MACQCIETIQILRVNLLITYDVAILPTKSGGETVGRFEIYKDVDDKWRWRFKSSGNYRIIADSAESYENRADCLHGVYVVKKQVANAEIIYV